VGTSSSLKNNKLNVSLSTKWSLVGQRPQYLWQCVLAGLALDQSWKLKKMLKTDKNNENGHIFLFKNQ
jgi:hypothetical protein